MDTGPLVALFDPKDSQHQRCREVLATISEVLTTTVPVLTEAFHMLSPGSRGARPVAGFYHSGRDVGLVYGPERPEPGFELMQQYADHPTDLADASLDVAAETLDTLKVFTIDRRDFATYRVRRGRTYQRIEVIP
jgi:uncharacterized protein